MGVTTDFWLDLKSVPQEKTHTWHYESGQEPMVGEYTGPRGEVLLSFCYIDKVSN